MAALDPDKDTLAEAKAWLRARVEKGERCPCCDQFAKVYKRKLNSAMARALICFTRRWQEEWVDVPEWLQRENEGGIARSREWPKLLWWGMLQEHPTLSGQYKITDAGRDFVSNRTRVPKYARVYDGRLLNLVPGETTSIREALGDDFNYDELMSW